MTTTNHKEIIHLLDDFVLGHLTPFQAKEVKSHLEGCPSCRRHAEELKRLGDEIHDYFEEQAEVPSTLWRKRLEQGKLPSQGGVLNSFWQRLQQIFSPLAFRPLPLAVSFMMGLLALPVAQQMGVRLPRFLSGLPVASTAQSVPIFAQLRSVEAAPVVLHPDTEIMTFRMSVEGLTVPGDQETRFRCQLFYQERIIAEQVVPAIEGEISVSVQAAILKAGSYRVEWAEFPLKEGRKRVAAFELVKAGVAGSPPASGR